MRAVLRTDNLDDYRLFIKARTLPVYRVKGHTIEVPDEYAGSLGVEMRRQKKEVAFNPSPFLFDYQRDIVRMALDKGKFAVFAECGLGKSLIFLEWARHVQRTLPENRSILIVSPKMVIPQTVDEAANFYGDSLPLEVVTAAKLTKWLRDGRGIGITNYEALSGDDVPQGSLGALILDESSLLKSHYGKWGGQCLRLGRGLEWKIALTGTPAPNDRIEFANHAVFLDAAKTVNEFLARYFVNRGQTGERWEMKPHAIGPFYRDLSHWCIFLNDPSVYGWRDNCDVIPPIHVHIDHVPMTSEQRDSVIDLTGQMFASSIGGIGDRSKLGQIAKGSYGGKQIETRKPGFIRNLIESWPDESTIVWCLFNEEQALMERTLAGLPFVSMTGATPDGERMEMIRRFKSGEAKILVSKPKILGFGLNLQIATRHVFSGLQDSYESFHQAVKRSNRIGSTRPLNVHIPVTEVEVPMIETVLKKAHRIEDDSREQERIFKEYRYGGG